MEATESITIDRPANEVWALVGDVRKWPEWIEDLSDFELEGDLAVGTELEYKYRGRPARAAVRRFEEGRAIEIGAEEKSWNMEESITLSPQGDQTEVTFSMAFVPTVGWAKVAGAVLSPLKGPLLTNPLKRELQELKTTLEA